MSYDFILKHIMDLLNLIVLFWAVYEVGIKAKKQSHNTMQDNKLDSQDKRIESLEKWKEKVNERLVSGNDHFRTIDQSNILELKSLVTIMDTLVSIVDDEAKRNELKKQRDELYNYVFKQEG